MYSLYLTLNFMKQYAERIYRPSVRYTQRPFLSARFDEEYVW